jgi:hypothetical protein
MLKWALITLTRLPRKLFGLVWVFVAIPFRAYTRNYVQNYWLQHNCAPKRLQERSPTWNGGGWTLMDIHGVGRPGFVRHRRVHKAWYYFLVFTIWGWLDDDSNHDTFDAGHIYNHYVKVRNWKIGALQYNEFVRLLSSGLIYGNTFDLGDLRARDPHFNFWAVLIWNTRNSAYNFGYLYEQSSDPKDSWYKSFGPLEFGWKPDGPGWHTYCCGLK